MPLSTGAGFLVGTESNRRLGARTRLPKMALQHLLAERRLLLSDAGQHCLVEIPILLGDKNGRIQHFHLRR